MSVFLGIDIGTSATKTIVVDETGVVLSESSSAYMTSHPRPLWSEQNPDDWWNATVKTVREAVALSGVAPSAVKAIGLSGQMHGAVFVDKAERIIRPAMLWNDQRTTRECEAIDSAVGGKSELLRMVGNPALTGFTLPKLLWLRTNEPDNYSRVSKLLLPKDEVRRRMTGDYATDVGDASGILLLDVKNRIWCKELIDRLEINESILPRLYESTDVTGVLTKTAAETLGLTTECVVVAGAGDCQANAVGNGVVTSGSLATSIGTSSVMMVHSDEYRVDPEGRIHTMCHGVPGKYFMMGVNLSGGGCLQWFRSRLCEDDKFNQSGAAFYDLLSDEAAKISAGSDGLYFLPFLSGERTPYNDPAARACFIGLTMYHGRGHMVRALMEGVAYNMRSTLELLSGLGINATEIRASGGGSSSRLWRQIQADVFGQSVYTINCSQGPAYGVALHAAVASKAFPDIETACASAIKISGETPSLTGNAGMYRKGFPTFVSLYHALKPSFEQIAAQY